MQQRRGELQQPGGPPWARLSVCRAHEALRTTDLRGADLSGAWLVGADLCGRDIDGACLADADLAGADLEGVSGVGAVLSDARLIDARLAGAILRTAVLDRVMAERADLARAGLSGARLWGADLRQASMEGVDLEGASLHGLRAEGASLQGARLSRASGRRVILSGADLGRATLDGAALPGLSARRAVFTGASLQGARLSGADLRHADLTGASLVGADLRGADLRGAVLEGAVLRGCDLGRARIEPAALRGASLDGLLAEGLRLPRAPAEPLAALLSAAGVVYGPHPAIQGLKNALGALGRGARALGGGLRAVWRRSPRSLWVWTRGAGGDALAVGRKLVGEAVRSPLSGLEPGVVADERDLSGLSMAGRDLHGASFVGARLVGTDFRNANLARCRMARADLQSALLTGATLVEADLRGALMDHARIDGGRLCGAAMDGARLRGTDLARADLRRASLRGARLEGVNLREADLRGADLCDATLDTVDLQGATLDGARLQGVRLRNVRGLSPSLPDDTMEPAAGEPAPVEVPPCVPEVTEAERSPPPWGARAAAISAPMWAGLRGATITALGALGAAGGRALAWLRAPEADGALDSSPPGEPAQAAPWEPGARQWVVGSMVAVVVGMAVFLGARVLGPTGLTDAGLEGSAERAAADGDPAAAADRFAMLADRSQDARSRASWLLERASNQARAGDLGGAVMSLEEAVSLDVDEPDLAVRARLMLAEVTARRDPILAVGSYEAILGDPLVPPEHLATALVELCGILQTLDMPSRKEALRADLLDLHSGSPESMVAVVARTVDLHLAGGRPDEALALLDQVPQRGLGRAERARWMLARARSLEAQERSAEALETYDSVLPLLSEGQRASALTRLDIARIYLDYGQLDRVEALLPALGGPGVPPDVRGRATLLQVEVHRRRGDLQGALALCRSVLDDHPQDELVLEARSLLGRLTVEAEGAGAMDGLLAALDDGGVEGEAAADAVLGHAMTLLERGEPEAALDLFEDLGRRTRENARIAMAASEGRVAALLHLDRHQEALELLRFLRSTAAPEALPRLDVLVGETLLQGGQVDEAEEAFTGLLDRPHGREGASARLGLARVAEARGQFQRALGLYEVAAELGGHRGEEALEGMASLLHALGRHGESVDVWRRLVNLRPPGSLHRADARLSLAAVLADMGDVDRAAATLRRLMADGGGDGELTAMVRLAELTAGDQEPDDEIPTWRDLHGRQDLPEDLRVDVLHGLARALTQAGRAEEALEVVDTALALDPEAATDAVLSVRADALAALGRADEVPLELRGEQGVTMLAEAVERAGRLRDQGDLAAALDAYEDLLDRTDDREAQASFLLNMAGVHSQMGDREEARRLLDGMAARYSDVPEAVFMSGFTLAGMDLEEHDPEGALARLPGLTPPDDGHALWLQETTARALAASGDEDAAMDAWRELLSSFPGDPVAAATAWTGMGDLRRSQGQLDGATALYQRAADLAPAGTTRTQAQLLLADTMMEAGDPAAARGLLETLASEAGDVETSLRVALARSAVLQEEGDWDAALAAVERGSLPKGQGLDSLGPDYGRSVIEARAVCLLALGRPEEARRAWSELRDLWPSSPEITVASELGLAEVEAASGDVDAAVSRLGSVQEITDDRFRQAQALFRSAQLLDHAGRRDEARPLYQEVLTRYGDEAGIARYASEALE